MPFVFLIVHGERSSPCDSSHSTGLTCTSPCNSSKKNQGHGTTSARGSLLEANGGNAEEHRQDRCGARTCEGIPRTSSRDRDEETGRMDEDAPAVSHAEARHQQRVRTTAAELLHGCSSVFQQIQETCIWGLSNALGVWLKLMAGNTSHAFMVAERFVRRRSFSVSCQIFGAGPSAFGSCVEGHPRAVKHSSSKLLWDSNDGRPQKLSSGTHRRNCNKWPQDIKQVVHNEMSWLSNQENQTARVRLVEQEECPE